MFSFHAVIFQVLLTQHHIPFQFSSKPHSLLKAKIQMKPFLPVFISVSPIHSNFTNTVRVDTLASKIFQLPQAPREPTMQMKYRLRCLSSHRPHPSLASPSVAYKAQGEAQRQHPPAAAKFTRPLIKGLDGRVKRIFHKPPPPYAIKYQEYRARGSQEEARSCRGRGPRRAAGQINSSGGNRKYKLLRCAESRLPAIRTARASGRRS